MTTRQKAALIGYTALAAVLVAAGTYLAKHIGVGSPNAPERIASAPPAPSAAPPAPTGPMVELSFNVDVQTFAGSVAPGVSHEAARNVFASNTQTLLDGYRQVLSGGPGMDDGMLVRLKVAPGGNVTAGSVRTSTAPNPKLDAAAIKSMMEWKFNPFSGPEVTIDYPVIFARGEDSADAVDKGLAHKVAVLSPSDKPEYGSTGAGAAP